MSMKKKIIIATLLFAVIWGASIVIISYTFSQKPNMTAEQVITKIQESNLPIDKITVYDEQTDVNKLLGRPNQYISKINFADSRLEQSELGKLNGGSIEVFSNTNDLNLRKEYLESVMKKSPIFTEYLFVNGNYLLRLSKDLTNDQVNKYKEIFVSIK